MQNKAVAMSRALERRLWVFPAKIHHPLQTASRQTIPAAHAKVQGHVPDAMDPA